MGISAGNKKMVGGHFISDIIDSDVLKILLGTREVFSAYVLVWKTKTFSYTGADQVFEVPEDCNMTIECWGAGSNNASGGYAKGVIPVTKGQKLSFMIGGKGSRTDNGTTYGFGGSTTYGGRGGGGLSGVFTGDTAIGANDASRVLVIAGGAGGGRTGGGAGGGTTGQNGNGGSYGYPGAGGTQTGRGSGGNTRSEQFRGGGGSGAYGFGGGGGWRGGNGSGGDGSGDDDAQAGGGSGHVVDSATDIVLTQGGGSAAGQDGSVKIRYLVKERPQPTPKARLPHEYQEVEYIESNGTQRMDLLTTPTSNTKVQFKFMPKGWTGWTALGYYTGNDNTDWRFFTSYGSTSAIYTDHPGRPVFDFNSSRMEGPDNTFALNTVYELEMGNYYLKYLDGENILTGNQISGFTGTTTIKLDYSYSVSTQASNRWYYVKIWNGDVLVKDFVPCYRVSDGTIGLYDLVEGKFYTNAGTGTFKKGASVNVWEMPSGYTELAYIGTTGSQFIDTGLSPTSNLQVESGVRTNSTAANAPVFGNYINDSSSYTSGNYYHLTAYSSKFYRGLNGSESNGGSYSHTAGNWYYLIYNDSNSNVIENGTVIGSSSGAAGYTGTTIAMARRGSNNSGNMYFGQYEYYYFKIYDKTQGKYVCDFVPCVRDSDGAIGLYDLVTKEFFANAGTGNFVAGPVVFRGGFKASPNTKLYVKMDTDLIDHSGKDVNITNSGVTLNTNVANVGAGYFDGNSRLNFPSSFFNMSNSDFTISFWCRDGAGLGTNHGSIFNNQWTLYSSLLLRYAGTKLYGGTKDKTWDIWSDVVAFDINQDTWVLWTMTRQGSNWKVYKNNVLFWSGTSSASLNYNASYTGAIGGHEVSNPNYYIGYISDFIVEQGAWSDQQRDEYFNATKALYGVS